MNSIQNYIEKIKQGIENREFLIALLILLVGLGSFGLGRLSKIEETKEPVRIEYSTEINAKEQSATVSLGASATQKLFVASKNGTKYHHPWCSGAERISQANKIWFNSKEEAEKAGYTPAANCKGL
ncbi:MAG: Ada metal-binding domain-containing protein [bacterium]|nr:Ada metal-binding domain-containing protein [bacterium]